MFRVKRTATVCAAQVCDMSALNADHFEAILESFPAFADEIEAGFSRYLHMVRAS